MSKHTPGPWSFRDSEYKAGALAWITYRATNGNNCEIAAVDSPALTVRENEANARLIAAAPELLEALKECVDQVGIEERDQLEALIAKAEGIENPKDAA